MDKSMRLGGGGRFAKVEAEAKAKGARNPKAVAAAEGMRKYGKAKMEQMAQAGRRRARNSSSEDEAMMSKSAIPTPPPPPPAPPMTPMMRPATYRRVGGRTRRQRAM